jgi:putative spermidine/putrescine transport system substrate-binding protein
MEYTWPRRRDFVGGGGLRHLGILAGVLTLLTACGGTSTATTSAGSAKSAADMGGMSALVDAAKKEGKLNVIAVPPDWANYGAIISGFTAKYGIAITSANPNGSSQQEIDAIKQLANTDRAPDVVDVGMKYAVANTTLFAAYQVSTWKDIPASQKEASGLWFQDYGGYMAIGYDSAKVPAPTSIQDLLGTAFKSKVALAGDPTQSNQGLNGVMMTAIANGGSTSDISKGVDFFHQLKQKGNFVPVVGTDATVKAGQTPVLFQWDYLSQTHVKDVPTWKVTLLPNAVLGGYYAQAINKQAPHPAAARLWEEYLYSDEGQNLWLKGGARPVRMDAMQKAGTLNAADAAALPAVKGTPVFMTEDQSTAAGSYVASHWAQAIG